MAKPGKPRKIPAHLWPLVAAELDAGATYERVQQELASANPPIEISISMLQKYRYEDRKKLGRVPELDTGGALERLNARAQARTAGTGDDTTPAAEPMPDGSDPEALIRRLVQDSSASAERARRLGDSVVAAREAKNLTVLSAQLAAAQRNKAASRDVLTFTRAELEQGMRSVREKVAAIVQRPLQCAGCARELAAALTGVDLSPPAVGQA